MSVNCVANPCPVIVNSSCVFYQGPNLICLGVNTNDTIENALIKINAVICDVAGLDGTSGTSGTSGSSGSSGVNGTSGTSGSNGSSGTNGTSGSNGNNGSSGTTGTSGVSGDQYRTVSETCFVLGDQGTITVETGLAYTPGQAIVISVDALNYQVCTVVSYNSITGELVFSDPITIVGTIAEYCQWDVNLNGAAGGDGSDGTSGTSGSSGISCLSAQIIAAGPTTIEYTDCSGGYHNYEVGVGYEDTICYQTGTLILTGSYTLNPLGICYGTSGTSGQSCNNIEVINETGSIINFMHAECNGIKVFTDINPGDTQTFCASDWDQTTDLTINVNGLCSGTSGTSGTSGAPGDAICPDHVKLAAVSGVITSSSYNTPILDDLFIGNNPLGWSYGIYGVRPNFDGFGNITGIKSINSNCGIILPVDLNEKDTVKLSGVAYMPDKDDVAAPKLYVTVSAFNCLDVSLQYPAFKTFTVIPVATYAFDTKTFSVCFSETVSLSDVLPADTTFFVVGIGAGNDDGTTFDVRFTYSLDVSQACIGGGKNLLIRNCCDPAYSEIIINNLVPVGESFVDVDGNCWTVDSETDNAITGARTLDTAYNNCVDCMAANPCPANFRIESCCGGAGQIFTAALVGVNVGDTFVDSNGFCWSAYDNTPLPITNVVEVGTVYPATDCNSAECTDANTCPKSVVLSSCCFDGWNGFTTLELLQAAIPSLDVDYTFVDTFGNCWGIKPYDGVAFPNMSFIIPATDYGFDGCGDCKVAHPCLKIPLYYTVQNCCTEEIEVVLLDPGYNIGNPLVLVHTTGAGCYNVLSWSNVGTPTITVVEVQGVAKNCPECLKRISEITMSGTTCLGDRECCTSFVNIGKESSLFVTGYGCDGTWIVDYELLPGQANSVCLSQVWITSTPGDGRIEKVGICCFDAYNPSLTENISVSVSGCQAGGGSTVIPPQTYLSEVILECANCVIREKGPAWEYAACPEIPTTWAFTESAFKAWPANTDGYTLYTDGFTDVDDGETNSSLITYVLSSTEPFYFNGVGYNNFKVSTNGFIFSPDGYKIFGNNGDLYLDPGVPLSDGDIQNLWYRNIGNPDKWTMQMIVYCGKCCGSPDQQTPYSYVLNLYSDASGTQYIETFVKTNVAGSVGPQGYAVGGTSISQVWRSNDNGLSWTYLGVGSVQ